MYSFGNDFTESEETCNFFIFCFRFFTHDLCVNYEPVNKTTKQFYENENQLNQLKDTQHKTVRKVQNKIFSFFK